MLYGFFNKPQVETVILKEICNTDTAELVLNNQAPQDKNLPDQCLESNKLITKKTAFINPLTSGGVAPHKSVLGTTASLGVADLPFTDSSWVTYCILSTSMIQRSVMVRDRGGFQNTSII